MRAELRTEESKVSQDKEQLKGLEDRLRSLTGETRTAVSSEKEEDSFANDPDFAGYGQTENFHMPGTQSGGEAGATRPMVQRVRRREPEEKRCCLIF